MRYLFLLFLLFLSGCFSQPDYSFNGCVTKVAESKDSSTYVVFGPAIITVKRDSDAIRFYGNGIGYSYLYGHQLGIYNYTMTEIDRNANHLIEVK